MQEHIDENINQIKKHELNNMSDILFYQSNRKIPIEEEQIGEYSDELSILLDSITSYNEHEGYDITIIERYDENTLIDIIKSNKINNNKILLLLFQTMNALLKLMTANNEIDTTNNTIIINEVRKHNLGIYNYLCLIIIIILSDADIIICCSDSENKRAYDKLKSDIINCDDDDGEHRIRFAYNFDEEFEKDDYGIITFKDPNQDGKIYKEFNESGEDENELLIRIQDYIDNTNTEIHNSAFDFYIKTTNQRLQWLINTCELNKFYIDTDFAEKVQGIMDQQCRDDMCSFIDAMSYYVGINGFDEFKENFEELDLSIFNTYDQTVLGYILILLYSII